MKSDVKSLWIAIRLMLIVNIFIIILALFACWHALQTKVGLEGCIEWGVKVGRLGVGMVFLYGAIVSAKISAASTRRNLLLLLSVLLLCFHLVLTFWDPMYSLTELAGYPHRSLYLRGWLVYSPILVYQKGMIWLLYVEILFMWWRYAKAFLSDRNKEVKY